MSLSEREQRILGEIERDLAASAPLTTRLPLAVRRRGTKEGAGRLPVLIAVFASLLAGIAILSAGLALGVPGMMIGGAALTQVSPFLARLNGLFRGRRGWR